jgi:moderate conductance mechanosensitive channel
VRLIHRLISRTVGAAAGRQTRPASAVLRGRNHTLTPEQTRQIAVAAERRRSRADTLASVLSSVASFVIFTIVAMMVIAVFGVNIGPLVASAGLVGVALGFGAQNLVRDFLSGLFMFFEDQCGVGDRVIVGETEGVVEALALRITRVRADDGTVWYLRNGEILKVGNISQGGDSPNLSDHLSTPEEERQAEQAAEVEARR